MKVFKMNDIDHVCAKDEEQAKRYYKDLTGFTIEEIYEEFEGEVPLSNTMLIDPDDLPETEKAHAQTWKQFYGEMWVVKPFDWVIKNENITEPCVICSTEI